MKRLGGILLTLTALMPAAQPALAHHTEIRAGDVVDRESLKEFVLSAAAYGGKSTSAAECLAVMEGFRADEAWKQGSIYLFVLAEDGTVILHGGNPDLEDRNLIDLEDSNGVRFTRELIEAAAEGGGFVEYLFDDPAVEGDEETGSPKVSYAIPWSTPHGDVILASGFYPGSVSTKVTIESWGQVKGGT